MADTTYVDGGPPRITAAWLQDLNNFFYRAAPISVLTTNSIQSNGANLSLNAVGGASVVSMTAGGLAVIPSADNTYTLGLTTNRWAKVFTSAIDSGVTGPFNLSTNNGTVQAFVAHVASAVNKIQINGGPAGVPAAIGSTGEATAALNLWCGTGGINFLTDINTVTQLQILRTASAVRNITITGAVAGGDPVIGTTAGSISLQPGSGVVIVGGVLTVGTNPALTTGYIRVPNGAGVGVLAARNNANTGDILVLNTSVINTVADIITVGGVGAAGVNYKGRSGSGAPTTSDLLSGQFTVWRDTVGATTKLYYNNAGTIQSVALA